MDKQYNDEEEILREGWEKRWKQFLKAHDDFETIKNKVCSSLKGHIYITILQYAECFNKSNGQLHSKNAGD